MRCRLLIWRLIEVFNISSESVLNQFQAIFRYGSRSALSTMINNCKCSDALNDPEVDRMKGFSKVAMAILFLLLISFFPFTAHSDVDWEISSAIQLDETPIDIAQAQDGELIYLLTDQAKVLIYSAAGKLVGTVPVDASVTDIAISANGDQLYLINSQRKTLKTFAIDFIVNFNIVGSPFLGPADAKVVVAVFSDFQ